jgi:glycosyltransferase involved in cell wall biosynthesis
MRLDARVRYRKNDPPVSAAANFSAAANEARGDYVVWIGDDDRLLPRCVERLLAARGRDTTVVFSSHDIIDADGKRLEEATRRATVTFARDRLPAGPVADPVASAWRQSMSLIGALFRTADVRGHGLRTDLRTGDFEFFVRLANEGSSFVYVPEFLFEYRIHPGGWTQSNSLDEGLIDVLEPIPVPAHLESLKRDLMARVLLGSVNCALKAGNVPQARAMIRNAYYPSFREGAVRVLVQRALSRLPGPVARSFFEILANTRRGVLHRVEAAAR